MNWRVTHGGTFRPEYRTWWGMLQRCSNPKNARYKRYGGRGIRVCSRWMDFALFYEDMGSRPSPNHSIDRINNDGNYEPSNCRWATRSEQQRNKAAYPKNNKLPRGDEHWTRRDHQRALDVARENIRHSHKSGSENGNAKLDKDSATAMRRTYAENKTIKLTELGRQFGVGRETARKVIRGIAW